MEMDSNIEAIVLRGEKDFILGTDYLCKNKIDLAHKGSENSADAEQYLRRLYDLIYDVSRLETPFLPLVNGRAFGSGACIAALSHFGIANEQASMRFPETGFGFVPTGGSTFLLSRLPGEVGMYLALTGHKLHGTDLEQLRFVHKSAEIHDSLISVISGTLNTRFPMYNTKVAFGDAWKETYESLAAYHRHKAKQDTNEIGHRLNIGKYWREQRENTKMTVADVIYNSMLSKDALESAPGTRYRDFGGQEIHNHLSHFETSILDFSTEKIEVQPLSIQQYLPAIYRCFCGRSLEEAMERLAYESHSGEKDWARATLAKLAERSPLSLEVTFRLVKNAYNLEWHECLQQEFQAALNFCKSPDFLQGATSALGRIPRTPEWQSSFPVSQDQVAEMMQHTARLEIDSKPQQLLPVKDYFREFPNSPRFWINEISPTLAVHRKFFEFEAKAFMNSIGFDLRDINIDVPTVRAKIYYKLMYSKRLDEEFDRIHRVAEDPVTSRIFMEQRLQAIEEFVGNEEEFKKEMQQALEQHFRDKFTERYELVLSRSAEAHTIKKREFFKELKDIIADKVFLERINDPKPKLKKINKVLETVPMEIMESHHESYLPALVNKKYEEYPLDPSFIYTADIATTEDAGYYYRSPNMRFTKKSEIFDHEKLKSNFAQAYCYLTKAKGVPMGKVKKLAYRFKGYRKNPDNDMVEQFEKSFEKKEEDPAVTDFIERLTEASDKYAKELDEAIESELKEIESLENPNKAAVISLAKEVNEVTNQALSNSRAKLSAKEEQLVTQKFKNLSDLVSGDTYREIEVNDPLYPDLLQEGIVAAEPEPVYTDYSDLESDAEESQGSVHLVPKDYLGTDLSKELFDKPNLVKELLLDVFVKTGCTHVIQGLEMLRTGNFEYDTEAMKERRKRIAHIDLKHDDRYYLNPEGKDKMKAAFSQLLLTPGLNDIDSNLLQSLELESSKTLLHELETAQNNRDKLPVPRNTYYKKKLWKFNRKQRKRFSKVDRPKPQRLLHVPWRMKFDGDYLKIIFGDRAFVPVGYEFDKEDLDLPEQELGLCNFKITAAEWLKQALKIALNDLFEQRLPEEMSMSYAELMAFDNEFRENLTPHGVRLLLQDVLSKEASVMVKGCRENVDQVRNRENFISDSWKTTDDYQKELNSNKEHLLLEQSHELRNYVKRIKDPKSVSEDTIAPALHPDPYYTVLEHEKQNNLLKGPLQTSNEYLEKWKVTEPLSVKSKKKEFAFRKKTLKDLKFEIIKNARLIKSLQELLYKNKPRQAVGEKALDEILAKNQNIL